MIDEALLTNLLFPYANRTDYGKYWVSSKTAKDIIFRQCLKFNIRAFKLFFNLQILSKYTY